MVSGEEVAIVAVVVDVVTGMISSGGTVNAGVDVVAVVGVEVATVVVVVVGVEIVVDVIVVAVGVKIGDVEVAIEGVDVGVSGISEMVVDPRCLLSHAATAVTPSCHDP